MPGGNPLGSAGAASHLLCNKSLDKTGRCDWSEDDAAGLVFCAGLESDVRLVRLTGAGGLGTVVGRRGASQQSHTTAKMASTIYVVASAAERGMLISGPLFLRVPVGAVAKIAKGPCAKAAIRARPEQPIAAPECKDLECWHAGGGWCANRGEHTSARGCGSTPWKVSEPEGSGGPSARRWEGRPQETGGADYARATARDHETGRGAATRRAPSDEAESWATQSRGATRPVRDR